jgi:hypothetical protein
LLLEELRLLLANATQVTNTAAITANLRESFICISFSMVGIVCPGGVSAPGPSTALRASGASPARDDTGAVFIFVLTDAYLATYTYAPRYI